jgi:tetratricopeptide (TPR) repeat protein
MSLAAPSPAAARLERLAGWLEQDPANASLLAEACDAAIACGRHEQAEAYIASAEPLAPDPAPWLFRRARIAIARRELAAAERLLVRARASAGDHPVLAHDLGYVHLLQGAFEACLEVVRPWLEAPLPPEQLGPLQLLWLRAMHRLHRGEEALAWARTREAAGALQPTARGAASLLALDQEEFALAGGWAEAALAADPRQVEALVARGCVALAQRDAARARDFLQQALQCNPEDGRTASALGLASLQAGELPLACAQLESALGSLPGHVGTWHALGWARLLQGERPGALAAFRSALALDPAFAESQGAVGLVLALDGQQDAARQHLELAQRLDPANVTGRYARALLAGEAADGAALERLVRRLLDRPGAFSHSLADTVLAQRRPPD